MGEIKCNICNRNFGTEESLRQHNQASHGVVAVATVKRSKKKHYLLGLIVVAVLLFSYTVYVRAQKPGEYDDFAKCLAEKGAVIYGNDFCSYTIKQLNYFGKSQDSLNYVKCFDNPGLCESKGVTTTPTWEIDGQTYAQVQTFEKLSALTGCTI